MCIDKNNFTSNVPDFLTCPICQNVMTDMIMVPCTVNFVTVYQSVGRKCMEEYMKLNNSKCFFCDKKYYPYEYHNLLNSFTSIKIHIDALSQLTIKCVNDCGWCDKYDKYVAHLDVCDFQKVECKYTRNYGNRRCDSILRKDESDHYNVCPYVLIHCDQCKQSYHKINEDKHIETSCELCNKNVYSCCLLQHKQIVCEKIELVCNYCNEKVLASNYEYHRQSECKKRYVVCKVCKNSYVFDDNSKHCETICEYCHIDTYKCMLNNHLETCDSVLMCCELCGEENIARRMLDYHFEESKWVHINLMCNKLNKLEVKCDDIDKTLKKIIKMFDKISDKFNMKTFDDQSDDE